ARERDRHRDTGAPPAELLEEEVPLEGAEATDRRGQERAMVAEAVRLAERGPERRTLGERGGRIGERGERRGRRPENRGADLVRGLPESVLLGREPGVAGARHRYGT